MRFARRCARPLVFMGILLLGAVMMAGERAEDLAVPVRLEADGKPIDHGAVWGHAGPCVHDVDGDGQHDLVVGDYGGTFTFYRNVGSHMEPRYESAGKLMAGEEPAKVRIYCCIGSSPQFADLNGDGHADLISGSYDPGACYWFPGNGDGTFQGRDGEIARHLAEARPPVNDDGKEKEGNEEKDPHRFANGLPLRDRTGQVILREPDQNERWKSFGSWPFPVDWDADGDLDLVIGDFNGSVQLHENLGTMTEFAFSETPVEIEAAGKPIMMTASNGEPYGHAAVVVADWDGDGLFDLVSGCNDGSVWWFKNTGRMGAPAFAVGRMLIGHSRAKGKDRFIEADEKPLPGTRTQVALADINGDGRLDLLTGDFSTTRSPRDDLTREEYAAYEKARDTYVAAIDAHRTASMAIKKEADKVLAGIPESERPPKMSQDKWWNRYEELQEQTEYLAVMEDLEATRTELQPFLEKPPEGWDTNSDYSTSHGFVWLYVRK